jgi:hypothetical protein
MEAVLPSGYTLYARDIVKIFFIHENGKSESLIGEVMEDANMDPRDRSAKIKVRIESEEPVYYTTQKVPDLRTFKKKSVLILKYPDGIIPYKFMFKNLEGMKDARKKMLAKFLNPNGFNEERDVFEGEIVSTGTPLNELQEWALRIALTNDLTVI